MPQVSSSPANRKVYTLSRWLRNVFSSGAVREDRETGAPEEPVVPDWVPPKVSSTATTVPIRTSTRVAMAICGFLAMRRMRSFMVRFFSVMVVAVRSRPDRCRPGTIMSTRVLP